MLSIFFCLFLSPRLSLAVDWPLRRAKSFCAENLAAQKISPGAIRGIEDAWPKLTLYILQREVREVRQTIVFAAEPQWPNQTALDAGKNLLMSFSKFALEGIWDISQLPERSKTGQVQTGNLTERRTIDEAAELVALDMAKWRVATEFVKGATRHFGADTRTWNSKVWAWLDQRCANTKITGPTRKIDAADIKLAALSLVDPDVISPEPLVAIPLEAGHRTERVERLNNYSLPIAVVYAFIVYKMGGWAFDHPVALTLEAASAVYLLGPVVLNPLFKAEPWFQAAFPITTGRLAAKTRTSLRNLLLIEDWSSPILVLGQRAHVAGLVKRLKNEGFVQIQVYE